jgi:ribosomal protein S18 acetylase RimI-like enzyme
VRSTLRADELGRAEFTAELAGISAVYAAAMNAAPETLPGRRMTMERHAGYDNFRALAIRAGSDGRIVAFAYGFHGADGQWWHDTVRAALTRAAGAAAIAWLADSLEVAEVHVHPDYQKRGIGRYMLLALADGRAERTAVLSTQDANSPARRLYADVGFTDLLTGYTFPGADVPYAVMGAVLPLRGSSSRPSSPPTPGR